MKLLLENWRRYLKEEKQLDLFKSENLYDNYYITYDFGGPESVDSRSTDKIEVSDCGEGIIGGANEGVGTVYLHDRWSGESLMKFRIHKYRGWIGDLMAVRDCSDYARDKCEHDDRDYESCQQEECEYCSSDLKDTGVITDEFLDEEFYSGHWSLDDIARERLKQGGHQRKFAKLGIALRESALALLQGIYGAKYYVFADATHQGGSNEAAQKVVKILVKRGALGREDGLVPSFVDEDKINQYLIFPILNPKNKFKIK